MITFNFYCSYKRKVLNVIICVFLPQLRIQTDNTHSVRTLCCEPLGVQLQMFYGIAIRLNS